jgi:hypothetical protein
MRSILEKALVHLLNEENEQADALFHKYMVAKAKQIHESLRSGDDALLESFDDINSDEMFTEDDLSDLEDTGSEFGGDDHVETSAEGEASADVADAGADLGDAGADMADASADLSDDLGGEAAEGDTIDRLEDLEAKLEALTAKFEAEVGPIDGDADADADLDTDAGSDDAAFGGEVDGDMGSEETEQAADVSDDMGDEAGSDEDKPAFAESEEKDDEDCEKDEDDKFEDLDESIINDLEKVLVTMQDGKEIGAGKSFTQNNKSAALQGKPNPMTDGKPVQIKASEHKGFERETAPATKDMKRRKNTKSNAEEGRSKVSKEGDKGASINKDFAGASTNDKSTLISR